jgi:hypothetical protein
MSTSSENKEPRRSDVMLAVPCPTALKPKERAGKKTRREGGIGPPLCLVCTVCVERPNGAVPLTIRLCSGYKQRVLEYDACGGGYFEIEASVIFET